ncbi:MAG: hypothetical protein V2A73_14080 [Pseudomonadota bacterium]
MLHWRIANGQGATQVVLYGEITELASFGELRLLRGPVVLDLAGVKRMNSLGVEALCTFLEELDGAAVFEAERCSPAVVSQLNILPDLAKHLAVRSVLVPIECPRCLQEMEALVKITSVGSSPTLPPAACDDCGAEMRLAEPAERYFAFLLEPVG